ncbi:MAG: AAA family ATPase [Armatimonadetes bacterium]|nr:AAA family ATPase [Armatimonadota bacterium]
MLDPTRPSEGQRSDVRRRVLDQLPSPRELALAVQRSVVGQDAAVRDLAAVMRQHLLRVRASELDLPCVPRWRDTVLLIGPTGSGKTHMVRTFARICGLPFHAEDCGHLSGTGYVGRSVVDAVQDLICSAGGDVADAQRGVLFLDELDKLRTQEGDGRDIRGDDVQVELLALVEGRKLNLASTGSSRERRAVYQGQFETHGLCIIAAGAFEGLDEIVRERLRPRSGRIGFGPGSATHELCELSRTSLLSEVTPDDLIAYGIRPELAGRLNTVIPLRELDESDLQRILEQEDGGPIARLREAASLEGLSLDFTPDFVSRAAQMASAAGLGARPLDSLVSRATRRAMFEVPGTMETGATLRFRANALDDGDYEVVPSRAGDVLDSPAPGQSYIEEPTAPHWLDLFLREDLPEDDFPEDEELEFEADEEAQTADADAPEQHSLWDEDDDELDFLDEDDEEALSATIEADMRALRFLAAFDTHPLTPGDRRTETVFSALVSPDLHEVARIVLLRAGVFILPRILGLTGHPDPRRREAAAWILGRMDNPVAREMVSHMITHDPDRSVRLYAREQLGKYAQDEDPGEEE